MVSANSTHAGNPSSWVLKFIECCFIGFAAVNVFSTLMELMPETLSLQSGNRFFNLLNAFLIVSALVFALLFPFYWQRQERKLLIFTPSRHALLQAIIRYWLAFEVSRYGFAKLLQTQFPIIYSRNDTVVSQLNGFDLTWNYFGHSYTLAVIIGLLQITGSVLLLFRRTTLLGAVILLPVLLNIVLIDWFFDIAWGALMNSVAFTLGSAFLISLRWKELKAVFLPKASHLPIIAPKGIKHLVRVGVLAISFFMILYFASFNSHKTLAGKWVVATMVRDGDTLTKNEWLIDSTAWKNIYIEQYGRLALCPNPYTYEPKRSQWAQYEYDGARHEIKLLLPDKNKIDTIEYLVTFSNNRNQMEWKSINKRESLALVLSKGNR